MPPRTTGRIADQAARSTDVFYALATPRAARLWIAAPRAVSEACSDRMAAVVEELHQENPSYG
jgi:hypothetical protein